MRPGFIRLKCAITTFLCVLITALAWPGAALAVFIDDDVEQSSIHDPIPGMTIRTNTQACINKYQGLYTLAGQYFNDLPAASSIKRLDILGGGISSVNAFTALPLGREHATEYYSLRSTYGSSDHSVAGTQSIFIDGLDPTKVIIQSILTMNRSDGYRIYLGARHSSCDADEKAHELELMITSGVTRWNLISAATPKCDVSIILTASDQQNVCGDISKKLTQLVSAMITKIEGKSTVIVYTHPDTMASVTITPDQVDTAEERLSVADSVPAGVYLAVSDLGLYSVGGGCYTGWPNYQWDPDRTGEEQQRYQLLIFLEQLALNGASKSKSLEFLNGILESEMLKDVNLSELCAKAKR